jgi:isoamylase
VYLILNAYWEPLEFELPPSGDGGSWRRWIDTSRDSPQDIVPWRTAPSLSYQKTYQAAARSVVVLFGGASFLGSGVS